MNVPPIEFICPVHKDVLQVATAGSVKDGDVAACQHGCRYVVIRGIYRFEETQAYATSFGIQWNRYRLTQLDSHTGLQLSRDRLERCLGVPASELKGKSVLEAGCGAGRFTEILLDAGAHVTAFDLSSAVEANYSMFSGREGYFVCQADLAKLPFKPKQFDYVVCLGVVQHTPSPEETIATLYSHVKPGGVLVFDHYLHGGRACERYARRVMLKLPSCISFLLCRAMVSVLWPFHRYEYRHPARRGSWRIKKWLHRYSPVHDYQSWLRLPDKALREWALLDTHDALTDYYKHGRTEEEIKDQLEILGLENIHVIKAGNGVEARGRKPCIHFTSKNPSTCIPLQS